MKDIKNIKGFKDKVTANTNFFGIKYINSEEKKSFK
jgi:hypothetical protein